MSWWGGGGKEKGVKQHKDRVRVRTDRSASSSHERTVVCVFGRKQTGLSCEGDGRSRNLHVQHIDKAR